MTLTDEQIAKLTVVVPDDSPVLCLVCLANDGIHVDWDAGQLPLKQLGQFQNCMVVPGPHWSCPRCSTKIRKGRGWGKCPCCKVSGPAQRERWTYIVECQCVLTPAQRQSKAEEEESKRRYADPDARREREKAALKAAAHDQAQAEAQAFAADRANAVDCLDDMPGGQCRKPENNLPHSFCHACPRFDHKRVGGQPSPARTPRNGTLEQTQPKVSTPLRDSDFETRPGFKETVAMVDAVADAFGDY